MPRLLCQLIGQIFLKEVHIVDVRDHVRIPISNEIVGNAEGNATVNDDPCNKPNSHEEFYMMYHDRPLWVTTTGMP